MTLGLALLAACGNGSAPVVGAVEFSGPPGSAQPFLYPLADGRVVLTWLEPAGDSAHTLRLAVRTDGRWKEPVTVATGATLLNNWADFPSFVATETGSWIVHWLDRVEGGTFAYHVRVATSSDEGRSWSTPLTPHRDVSPTEHGFVSMVPLTGDSAALIWLDGRAMVLAGGTPDGDMQIRFGTVTGAGAVADKGLLDQRTCECCQTALVRTTAGLVAAYRDRSAGEIRDIAIVRYADGRWTDPSSVADDGFYYPGCPVNGPQLAATGDTVVLAWYTAPEQRARVQVARSADGGVTWSAPMRVDVGDPLGRVDVELLPDGSAFVVWIERTPDAAAVLGRRIEPDGRRGDPVTVAITDASRGSGFPRTARIGNTVLVAWRDMEGEGAVQVRTVRRTGGQPDGR